MIQASQAEKNRAAQATKFKKEMEQKENGITPSLVRVTEPNNHQSKGPKNCKICIQGLIDDKKMHHVNESDIHDYFQGYGTIENIEIPRDHITQRPRGYAIIEFARSQEAKDAVSLLNGFEIDGKKINVQIYTEYL